jgi:phosphoribosylaminoimidazolecarboxamide formyltransferase / IMP cyclohydrolase
MTENDGATTEEMRFYLAKKVFALTSAYDKAITEYLAKI